MNSSKGRPPFKWCLKFVYYDSYISADPQNTPLIPRDGIQRIVTLVTIPREEAAGVVFEGFGSLEKDKVRCSLGTIFAGVLSFSVANLSS